MENKAMTIYYGVGSAGLGLIVLIAYVILQVLGIPSGNFIDWVIGVLSFWWLLAIVTLPWNVYFDAQETIAEAQISESKGMAVDRARVGYAHQVLRWALILAIALHLLSAIALYLLAVTGISAVGYVSSGAALLFTALRPAARAYRYIAARLWSIRHEIKYPREDVFELRDRVFRLEQTVKHLEELLDPQEPHSWVATLQRDTEEARRGLANLRALLEQSQARNEVAHQQLAKEATNAIAQLSEDSQVLGHVREIIQFFKTA